MTINRRKFIFVSGLVPASPLLAMITIQSTVAGSSPRLPPQERVAPATNANEFVLKIEGWEVGENASAPAVDGEVWITVGPSWRVAWR